MNTPRVPMGTRTLSRPLGCQRRWQGGGGVNIEMTRGGSGDAGGDARGHPRVHSLFYGFTSLCWVLICGLPAMWSHQRERKRKRGRKKGVKDEERRRREVIVTDLRWTEDMSPLISRPCENILTKWSPVWTFTSSQCDYRIVSGLFKPLQCNFALWRPRVARRDNIHNKHCGHMGAVTGQQPFDILYHSVPFLPQLMPDTESYLYLVLMCNWTVSI